MSLQGVYDEATKGSLGDNPNYDKDCFIRQPTDEAMILLFKQTFIFPFALAIHIIFRQFTKMLTKCF